MTPLFLIGPLACDPVFGAVVGDSQRTPARLRGQRALSDPGRCFDIVLQAGEGALEGVLLDNPDAEIRARVEYFARTAGQSAQNITVNTQKGPQVAQVYVSNPTATEAAFEWQSSKWKADWGALAGIAVAEIMARMGETPAEVIAMRLPMILGRAGAHLAARETAPASLRSRMARDDVQEIEQITRHAGFFVTNEYKLRHPQYDGSTSAEVTREVFICTDAAIVLPYDPVLDRVLLIEQFRMGPYGRGDPLPWVLEPVAGRIDGGETPEATAYRECIEEAGLHLRGLEHINSHYCSPGSVTEFFHCYLGLCDLPDTVTGSGGLATEHEDIRTHVLAFDAAAALVETGEVNVGPLVLMLYWLGRERPRLRAAA